MKNHIRLGIAVVALGAIAAFLILSRPVDRDTTATDEHKHEEEIGGLGGEAGHEGETGHTAETKAQEKPEMQTTAAFTPQLPAEKGKRTRVRLETGMGQIEILLYDDLAPKTVKNFLNLVSKGFYTKMVFHRVVKGFVIQAGDPTGAGGGGPGYAIPDEIVSELKHNQPGVVAMARSASPNSAGSQFYITMGPTPHLDGAYSIFGQVVKGMDVAAAINGIVTDRNGRPINPVALKEIVVLGQE